AFVGLSAPGSGLTVAAPGGGYITIKTTDMAAALTAGVAALIRAKYPRLSPAQVNQALTHGSGALSAIGAIQAAAATAARLPRPETAPAARPGSGGFPAAITGGFPALSSHGAHAAPRGNAADPRGTGSQPDGVPLTGRVQPPSVRTGTGPGAVPRPGAPAHSG